MNNAVFANVHGMVKTVPAGKVTTYGAIAKKMNLNPRTVGWAMHANKSSDVPCHRVVDRNGRLAPNFAGPPASRCEALLAGPQSPGAIATGRQAFDGWKEQKRRLMAEGVTFRDEMHVEMEKHLYKLI